MFLLLVRHVIVIVRDVSTVQDATVLFSVSSTDLFHHLNTMLLACPAKSHSLLQLKCPIAGKVINFYRA
jgi:hypothetical protein